MPRPKPIFRIKSIIGRIVFLHVIAVGIICFLMPLMLYWLLARETDTLHRIALREHAEMLATNLKKDANGDWTLDLPRGVRGVYSQQAGRFAYAIADENGNVMLSSLPDRGLIFAMPNAESETIAQEEHGDAVMSGISVPEVVNGQTMVIQVAENLRHRDVIIDDIVGNFMQRVGWVTLPILMTLLLIDILIFRRALRPVLQASAAAQHIGPSRTDIRLPTDGVPREIVGLVHAVNKAFDRLEEGLRAQRDFAADAAHELRTPLTILRTRVDTSPETPLSDAVRKDVERMTRVVNQLIDLAELETSVVETRDVVNLNELCAEVVEYLAPLAVREGKELALAECPTDVRVVGNRETLFRAIRNLAENALDHTPKGTAAEIEVGADGTVTVVDDGPGIREEDRIHLFERFWRRDRRSLSGGLGLAIVQRIAEAHSGSIIVDNRPQGGARFRLCLPVLQAPVVRSKIQGSGGAATSAPAPTKH